MESARIALNFGDRSAMFCTQCGRQYKETDRFCAGCGESLDMTAPANAISADEDWRHATDPFVVLGHPDVKARIAAVSGSTPGGMSAEQFIKYAQPLINAASGAPVPTLAIAKVALPIYEKMGLKMQQDMRQGFKSSFGETLAAVFCSLAARGQPLKSVTPANDGCILESEMASSVWSWAGSMTLTLQSVPEGTLVQGAIQVPGQKFDFGRSKRVLESLFSDVLTYRDLP